MNGPIELFFYLLAFGGGVAAIAICMAFAMYVIAKAAKK